MVKFRQIWSHCIQPYLGPYSRVEYLVTLPTPKKFNDIASKKAYRGVNIVPLWAASQACGFSSGIWGTYRQWSEAGAQVRKGEKSSYVVFYKELEYARAEDWADAESETRLFARATPVFAAEQVEGFNAEPASDRPEIEPIDAAEAFVRATGAAIAHGGTRAYYRPSTDSIQLPDRAAFVGSDLACDGVLAMRPTDTELTALMETTAPSDIASMVVAILKRNRDGHS